MAGAAEAALKRAVSPRRERVEGPGVAGAFGRGFRAGDLRMPPAKIDPRSSHPQEKHHRHRLGGGSLDLGTHHVSPPSVGVRSDWAPPQYLIRGAARASSSATGVASTAIRVRVERIVHTSLRISSRRASISSRISRSWSRSLDDLEPRPKVSFDSSGRSSRRRLGRLAIRVRRITSSFSSCRSDDQLEEAWWRLLKRR